MRREADHSHPSSAKIKNTRSYTSTTGTILLWHRIQKFGTGCRSRGWGDSAPSNTGMMTCGKRGCVGQVAAMWRENGHGIFVANIQRNRIVERPSSIWEDNIKTNLKDIIQGLFSVLPMRLSSCFDGCMTTSCHTSFAISLFTHVSTLTSPSSGILHVKVASLSREALIKIRLKDWHG
jgi:hypothetical protein